MGLISAALSSIGGNLADQWLEAIEASDMEEGVVCTKGTLVRNGEKRNNNRKGSSDYVSNGSIIHVNQNQFMMLVDGGKIVDYSAEPGYYKVENSTAPSLFNGQFKDSLKDAWNRFKFSGTPSQKQEVFYINLQEIKGIKFGTQNPIQYFDNFYNAELFLRTFGTYSIKIINPILFFQEACPRNTPLVHIDDINHQYLSEFLEALQAAINQMSVDGQRISHISSKGRELSKYMAETLDDEWTKMRGMEVLSVGIASISYDDASRTRIDERNRGAMMADPNIRQGYKETAIASGIEAAGSNEGGAAGAFMGVGLGLGAGGSFMAAGNQQQNDFQIQQMREQMRQMQEQLNAKNNQTGANQAGTSAWICKECNTQNMAKFCSNCGSAKPASATCVSCSAPLPENAKFCSECGAKQTQAICPQCSKPLNPGDKFCPDCGHKIV